MDFKKDIGKKIKLARIEMDLNQTELGQALGLRQKTISHYETGRSLPTLVKMLTIMTVLKKPITYFL